MLARAARALRTCTRRALSSRVLGGPADAAQHPTKAAAEGGARAAPAPPAAGCTCVEHLADAAVLQSVTSKCSSDDKPWCEDGTGGRTTVLAFHRGEAGGPALVAALEQVRDAFPAVKYYAVDLDGPKGLGQAATEAMAHAVHLPAFRVLRYGVDQPLIVDGNTELLRQKLAQLS